MVKTMKIKLISFLLILVCYGVHAAPLIEVENNFASDDFACPNATFNNNDDVINYFKLWKNCKHADGGFIFNNARGIDFSAFKNITTINQLHFHNTDFSNVATIFPQLTKANSILFEHSTNLSELSLPSLSYSYDTTVLNSTNLPAKLFPALKETKLLTINNSTGLGALSFPQLYKTSLLVIDNNKQAVNLDRTFPSLTSADEIRILNNQIKEVQFPALKSLKSLSVTSNELLQKVSIPELQNAEIDFLQLGVNNDNFDQIGGDKGGLTDIKNIQETLNVSGSRLTITNYPRSIRGIMFDSDIPQFQLDDIVKQLFQLNPHSEYGKTMVVFFRNTCKDLGDLDTSKYDFDLYDVTDNGSYYYPTKCGN